MAKAQTNAESHLKQEAVKIGKQVREKLDKAAVKVMDAFYSDYTPKYYDRTNNLRNMHRSRNNIEEIGPTFIDHVTLTFSAEYMSNYVRKEQFIDFLTNDAGVNGFASTFSSVPINISEEQKRKFDFEVINPRIVFDLDFMQGYHGGKTWGKTTDWHNRQPAKKMTPSPYEMMEIEYEKVAKQTDAWTKNDKLVAEVNAAMEADIAEILNRINNTTGGK